MTDTSNASYFPILIRFENGEERICFMPEECPCGTKFFVIQCNVKLGKRKRY